MKKKSFLQKLFDEGKIYKADYNGFYSVRQEQFVTEKEKADGQWPSLYGDVVERSPDNLSPKLSDLPRRLLLRQNGKS